jgi:hypothetical protein
MNLKKCLDLMNFYKKGILFKTFKKGELMKKIIFVLICFFSFSQAFAILPPFYHTVREIKAILDDPILHEKLGSGEMILSVEKEEAGWSVITHKYILHVDVKYIPTPGICGPGQFELEFQEPVEKALE